MSKRAMPVATPLRHIVLVGGGHAHVQVLEAFGAAPVEGWQITLVADQLVAPYSGMLPGCIAGDYSEADIHIDLVKLAAATGARFVQGRATDIHRLARGVEVMGQGTVSYDLLSINVGITPDLSGIEGAAQHAVPIKPIAGLLHRLARAEVAVRALDRPAHLVVIGGGAAGVELAIAMHDRNARIARFNAHITLIAGGGLAPTLNAPARRRVQHVLDRVGIHVVQGDRAVNIAPGVVHLASGARVQADVAFVSTHARLPDWLAQTDLPKASNGGLWLRPTLQLQGEDAVFAAGDCATMVGSPRPRAGVYAVRQGPVLAANLRAAALGHALQAYTPQVAHLVLLRTGHGRAIGARGRFFWGEGRWLWWLKDYIDRRFMARFQKG